MFRRETIIALRARHQAYRIASDIANPHVDTPEPPQPALPIDAPNWGWEAYQRRLRRGTVIVLAWVWGLVIVYWMFYWMSTRGVSVMWRRGRVHRGPTMIALRARREAMQVAEKVAFPHIDSPPPPRPSLLVVPEWWPDDSYYEPSLNFVEPPPPEPAPAWFKWLFCGCLTVSVAVGYLLIKYLG